MPKIQVENSNWQWKVKFGKRIERMMKVQVRLKWIDLLELNLSFQIRPRSNSFEEKVGAEEV